MQRPDDIAEVRKVARGKALVMAKLEKPQALARLDEIMEVSDALMVARGDLGVEMPLEKVPGLQKRIVRGARRLGKPVVVATQMLELMITAPVPTRAEVSDVATAVYEGADAVMLSAESASGQYPIEAVATMNRIAEACESDAIYWSIITAQRNAPEATGSDAIAAGAHQIADTLGLKSIAAWTFSGSTAFRLARERPNSTVIALTPNIDTARRLALVWGVHSIRTKDAQRRRRHGVPGLQVRGARRLCAGRRPHHHRRRRPLRHARRHEHGAHRLHQPGARGEGVSVCREGRSYA